MYHASLTGEPPGASGYVHMGDQDAALNRIHQVEGRLLDHPEVVTERVLHGKQFNPRLYHVSVTEPAMNSPEALVTDSFANDLTGERHLYLPRHEATARGWDGDPKKMTAWGVKMPMSDDEWREHMDEVVSNAERRAVSNPWSPEARMHQNMRQVWESVKQRGGEVGPVYYDNSGERTKKPSLVAPASSTVYREFKP